MSAKLNVVETEKREDVIAITTGSLNTSQKIRALAALEIPRGEIALLLEKRYQHVRNVLETKLTTKA